MQDSRIDEAMRQVPRADFLRPEDRDESATDAPLPIGHGQSSSQPRTVRRMLQLLSVEPGHRVLDVGAGSGWTTALLASLVGPEGLVVGVELVPDLAEWGQENVERAGSPWASVRVAAEGVLGWPDLAPYDRVLVSAEARELPQSLVDQLTPEGVLVAPVQGSMVRVRNVLGGPPKVSSHGAFRFVPLR